MNIPFLILGINFVFSIRSDLELLFKDLIQEHSQSKDI